MNGRRAAVGLSLLCALLFSAFAAQSASAKGTTAYTCSQEAGPKNDNLFDFTDAHCDNQVEPKKGTWGHVLIEGATEVTVTNAKTKNNTTEGTTAILLATVLTQKTEIICHKVHGTSTNTNETPGGAGTEMQNNGINLVVKYTECTVPKPTANCEVEEPIEVKGTSTTLTNVEGKGEMGVEFKPEAGKPFTTIKFKKNAECLVSGASVPVEGTAIATGSRGSTAAVTSSGATLIFTEAMTEKTLKVAKATAKFSSTVTVKMKLTKEEEEKGEDHKNAITLTTTEP